MEKAKIILNQLGGNKFIVMTGAKNFLAHKDGLSFRLPGKNGYTKQGINYVRIKLNGNDLYDVEYARIHGLKYTVKEQSDDIFFDMLQDDFTKVTGLYTHL